MDTGVKEAAAGEGATGEVGVVVVAMEEGGEGVTMRGMIMGGKSAGHAPEDAPDQDPGRFACCLADFINLPVIVQRGIFH